MLLAFLTRGHEMTMAESVLLSLLALGLGGPTLLGAQARTPSPGWLEAPQEIPAVKRFLGIAGVGQRDPAAPPELEQWGRLAGIWVVDQQIRKRDSSWVDAGKGVWVWRYALEGFAVSDLWYQSADALPSYLEGFGRDYLLSGVRVFEAKTGAWRVAFVGNGAGSGPGADFSTFEARWDGQRMVMTGPPIEGIGKQRVVFLDLAENSFRWVSEYSQDDGKTWVAYMRLFARRHR